MPGVGAAIGASGGAILPQFHAEPSPDFGEHMVSGLCAHGFVEDLEVIDVRQQQGIRAAGIATHVGKGTLQPVEKTPTVGQSGERIMKEVVFEKLLGSLALRYIAVHDHQLRDLALAITNGAGDGFEYAPASVLVLDAVLQRLAESAFARSAGRLQDSHAVVGMNLLERRRLA